MKLYFGNMVTTVTTLMILFKNEDNWPDVAELVNLRGDETTVYLLADGR